MSRKERATDIGDLPISFGRFLGRPINEVPRRYLEWALRARIPSNDRWAIERFLREGGRSRRHGRQTKARSKGDRSGEW